ncbi:MAG: hypothetical protein A2Y71_03100 [Bacteroidetes bacterium RBG_13_42_15]|nr:MAG: hypothetical protein A2Y71_03100 [Bacteroidetes bacterium RBG_13_42_15]
MNEDKITITISRLAGQIFMDVYNAWLPICKRNIDDLKLRLNRLTTSDIPDMKEASEIADALLFLQKQYEGAREAADRLRENDIYPEDVRRAIFDEFMNKNPDKVSKPN